MAKAKQGRLVKESTWKKLHAAYVTPRPLGTVEDTPDLPALARRFKVPLREVECRASLEEWTAERDALEARQFFKETAPGIKTELAYCAHKATEMAADMAGDLGAIGGEELLRELISDARVIWRKRMSRILVWEAMQSSRRYGPRLAGGQRARTPHGRAERVA